MVQIAYARRPLARKNTRAGFAALGPDQFEGYASLFGVADGGGDTVAPGAFTASLRRRPQVRMLYHTPRQALGLLADGQELDAMQINDALIQFDAMTDICLLGQFVNTPPASPADGDMYLLGAAPTGAWSGRAYKIAYCLDGGWRFYAPFNGLRAYVTTTHGFLVYMGGAWTDANALISASEVSLASAAICDLGATGSLFVAITGSTTITGFGTVANLLRFVRFAGALTLTHNAASLILPGSASLVTAAGDTALFASDASGNWRCRSYSRANGVQTCFSGVTGSGNAVGSASPTLTGTTQMAALTASGVVAATGGGGTYALFNGTTDKGYITHQNYNLSDGSFMAVATSGATPLDLATNNTRALRVGTDQSVLVGTTTNGGWTGTARLAVSSATSGISSHLPSGTGYAYTANIASTSAAMFGFFYNSAAVGSITTSGSATVYGTSSDERLKCWETVAQVDCRDAIRKLWVGHYEWKASGAPGFGIRAQQAYAVMPHHAGVTRPTSEDGDWHASAEPFAYLALWGVKDLYAMIEALEARIAALEARHAAG